MCGRRPCQPVGASDVERLVPQQLAKFLCRIPVGADVVDEHPLRIGQLGIATSAERIRGLMSITSGSRRYDPVDEPPGIDGVQSANFVNDPEGRPEPPRLITANALAGNIKPSCKLNLAHIRPFADSPDSLAHSSRIIRFSSQGLGSS